MNTDRDFADKSWLRHEEDSFLLFNEDEAIAAFCVALALGFFLGGL